MKLCPKSLSHLTQMAMTPRCLTLRTNLLWEWISTPFLLKPKKIFSQQGIWVIVVLSQVFRALMLPQGSMAGLRVLWLGGATRRRWRLRTLSGVLGHGGKSQAHLLCLSISLADSANEMTILMHLTRNLILSAGHQFPTLIPTSIRTWMWLCLMLTQMSPRKMTETHKPAPIQLKSRGPMRHTHAQKNT